jgi:mannosyl-oligosaccharide alpha-1,2-mannosidase
LPPTKVEKPVSLAHPQSHPPAIIIQDSVEDGRQRVIPGAPPGEVITAVIAEAGEGRKEEDTLPADVVLIRWEPPEEHFPVAETIQMPVGTPKPIPKIQHEFEKESSVEYKARLEKLEIIKDAFLHAWNNYKENAWGKDELTPVTASYKNPFNGWGATLVDSLDTLWIMGLKQDFEEAVARVSMIDFQTSRRGDIPLFETVIRYLGGLLGAYDVSGGQYRVLLDKAVELGEILIGAFDTPNRMPITFYQWKP